MGVYLPYPPWFGIPLFESLSPLGWFSVVVRSLGVSSFAPLSFFWIRPFLHQPKQKVRLRVKCSDEVGIFCFVLFRS